MQAEKTAAFYFRILQNKKEGVGFILPLRYVNGA